MYEGFYNLIYAQLFNNGVFNDDNILALVYNWNGSEIEIAQYFSCLIALICTITVYVICCLCVYKVIRLFGRLWSRF